MWFSDFRIVLRDRIIENGALRIENGLIAEIREAPVANAAIYGAGKLMLAGFIDMHGDMIERELEPRPNVKMPLALGLSDLDRKLAGCGITTAYAALSFSPNSTYGHLRSYEHTSAVIRALKAAGDSLLIDHKIHARFEVTFPKALDVVKELMASGNVDLISLCDHTPGQGQYRDIELIARQLSETKGISLEEAMQSIAKRIEDKTQPADVLAHTLRDISVCCHAHNVALASHDDDTAEKVGVMKALGADISEFPVTREAAVAARAQAMLTVMGAPNALRGRSYSGNLSAREAYAEGLLDILCSDYHPSAMLPAVLTLAQTSDLVAAARLVSFNPAKALGLADRGEIALGKRADLVLASGEGIGRVHETWVAGRCSYSDGTSFTKHSSVDRSAVACA